MRGGEEIVRNLKTASYFLRNFVRKKNADMKKILLLTVSLLCCCGVWALKPLKKPLVFVSPDSVVFWARDFGNPRLVALMGDSSVYPQRTVITKKERRAFKAQISAWEQRMKERFNLVGGSGDEVNDLQTLPAADMLYRSATLLLQTADGRFAEAMERTLYNALPSAILAGVGMMERSVASQALMNASGMVFATDDEGVYVNFYTNSYARVRTDALSLTLDVMTAMPLDPRVKVRVGGLSGQQSFKLRLYMPKWAQKAAGGVVKTYLNGREEEFPIVKGYLEIDRRWRNGEEVFFDLPFHPAYVHRADGSVALMRGPVVYVMTTPVESFPLPEAMQFEADPQSNALRATAWKADGTTATLIARPYAERQGVVWMKE